MIVIFKLSIILNFLLFYFYLLSNIDTLEYFYKNKKYKI